MRDLIDRLRRPIYGDQPPTFSKADEELLREVRDRLVASVASGDSEEERWNARQRANVAAACVFLEVNGCPLQKRPRCYQICYHGALRATPPAPSRAMIYRHVLKRRWPRASATHGSRLYGRANGAREDGRVLGDCSGGSSRSDKMIRRHPRPAAGRYDAWPKLAWGAAPAYSRRVSRMRVRRRSLLQPRHHGPLRHRQGDFRLLRQCG